jgi:hypothetical protein
MSGEGLAFARVTVGAGQNVPATVGADVSPESMLETLLVHSHRFVREKEELINACRQLYIENASLRNDKEQLEQRSKLQREKMVDFQDYSAKKILALKKEIAQCDEERDKMKKELNATKFKLAKSQSSARKLRQYVATVHGSGKPPISPPARGTPPAQGAGRPGLSLSTLPPASQGFASPDGEKKGRESANGLAERKPAAEVASGEQSPSLNPAAGVAVMVQSPSDAVKQTIEVNAARGLPDVPEHVERPSPPPPERPRVAVVLRKDSTGVEDAPTAKVAAGLDGRSKMMPAAGPHAVATVLRKNSDGFAVHAKVLQFPSPFDMSGTKASDPDIPPPAPDQLATESAIKAIQRGDILVKYASKRLLYKGQERWVRLNETGDCLEWGSVKARFTNKMTSSLRLENVTAVYCRLPGKDGGKRTDWHCSFFLHDSDRSYEFACPSMMIASQWIFGLQSARVQLEKSTWEPEHSIFRSRGSALLTLFKIHLDMIAQRENKSRRDIIINAVNRTLLQKMAAMAHSGGTSRMDVILNLPQAPKH